MAMQYDGKTYRNLQEQVAYLTAKWQQLADEIDEVRAQIPSKMIVEELPEEGDPLITYYVGPKGTEPNLYYEVWVWVQEEPDGPFVWRELEDTDQVDLSGYLPIQDGETTYPQAYIKIATGEQSMYDVSGSAVPYTLALRDSTGKLRCTTPGADSDATNKKYVDDGFLAKQTGTTTWMQAYVKNADGTNGLLDVQDSGSDAGTIVRRLTGGQIVCGDPTARGRATTRGYVEDNFLAKQTGAGYFRAYTIETDGTQSITRIYQGSAEPNTLVYRTASGQVVCADPTGATHAATKAYVDAAVGQLLYLHDIEIIVTVDATNKLYIKAYLVNGSSTAITSIDRATFNRMDVQYGAYGPARYTANTCAVTKCPDGLHQDEFDEPNPAYLYQYMSGGSLVSGVTTYAMSVTVVDTVISF